MPSLKNSVRPVIAAPPGSFGHVANSRAMIFSTLLSATGESAGAEPAIRVVINATDASSRRLMGRTPRQDHVRRSESSAPLRSLGVADLGIVKKMYSK